MRVIGNWLRCNIYKNEIKLFLINHVFYMAVLFINTIILKKAFSVIIDKDHEFVYNWLQQCHPNYNLNVSEFSEFERINATTRLSFTLENIDIPSNTKHPRIINELLIWLQSVEQYFDYVYHNIHILFYRYMRSKNEYQTKLINKNCNKVWI